MEIIKRGQIPGKITHRATCYNCKSEVEFLREEGHIHYDQRDGDFITVQCPVCGSTINSDLNKSVYNRPG